ncbi:MAG TPA: pyrroloquinoline quinone biosynthesis protein PqqB [Micromonosporaceae bacterium]|nr:pyrroloquinoline quinone biosynthesis protein PqqB [Micromonosporaceae bacterium]
MKLRLLGTAAGGGSPQWNCACQQCLRARQTGAFRSQESALLSGNGSDWYLINASPDLRSQLLAAKELTPGPGLRETPLRGVLLTDAELDHTLGLFSLREAGELHVYATAAVLEALESALPVRPIVDPYGTPEQGWRWRNVYPGKDFDLPGGLFVTAFSLGEKKPRYAQHLGGSDWVVGYRIEDESGRVIVYAPCFAEWTDALDNALADAEVAVIDGTFATAKEMPNVKGHLSIADSQEHLARHPGTRFRYTHLNNTNPFLSDPQGLPLAGEMELL